MRYRTFPHAKAATVFSWVTGVISALAVLTAAVLGALLVFARVVQKKNVKIFGLRYKVDSDWIKLEVILIIAGILLALASKYLGRKLAELTIRRKIKGSVKFAYNYCSEDPSYYKYAVSLNRDFARKYGLDLNTLKIVERKRRK
jgi:hypothetical protein